jgi:hypothetical protein
MPYSAFKSSRFELSVCWLKSVVRREKHVFSENPLLSSSHDIMSVEWVAQAAKVTEGGGVSGNRNYVN